MSLDHGNTETIALSKRYREFSEALRGGQSGGGSPASRRGPRRRAPASVLIIQRRKNRVILNANELAILSSDAGHTTEIADLDDLPFSQQRQIFVHTDVLVSMAGTALHNVLFMRPGSAVVMFMQPMWCEHAWMYANQAVLLGIKPFIYCAPSTPPVLGNSANSSASRDHADSSSASSRSSDPEIMRHYGWTRQTWLQGPREHKSDNITVDAALFEDLLAQAVAHTEALRNGTAGEQGNLGRETAVVLGEQNMNALMCPGTTGQHPPAAQRAPTRQTPNSDTSNPAMTSFQSNVDRPRLLEVYVTAVSAEFNIAEQGWKVGINGELGAAQGTIDELLRSTPHLAICMESTDMAPWCYPLNAFNYYTDLFLYMAQPQQGLHFWAQVSSAGGKIRNSDAFVVLDCRLPEAGFGLHKQLVGRDVRFEVNISQNCSRNTTPADTTQTAAQQVLTFPTQKVTAEKWLCQSTSRVLFHQRMTSRLSLQRLTADFCLLHAVTPRNCVEFVDALQRHLRKVLRAELAGLPPVQYAPTELNPFFFMHVEKTAGTTLREYINASAEERGLRALIPCHTDHCRVFAAPLHRPEPSLSAQVDVDVSGTASALPPQPPLSDWVALRDLRLVQPPARDNSDISIVAGHFDFYAPFQSLPQCADASASSKPAPAQLWSTHILHTADAANPDHVALPQLPAQPGCRVSCLTISRHPVDRAISYYYQRFYQRPNATAESVDIDTAGSAAASIPLVQDRPLNQKMINELTAQELEQVALSTREALDSHFYPDVKVFIDEGMSDAACAAVLGLKFTTGRVAAAISLPPEIPRSLYPQARSNLQQCVIGLQERWADTLHVLDHWLPWIDFSRDPQIKKMSLYSGLETRTTLRRELYEVLVKLNPCDMMLYEEAQRLFAQQMEVLREP